MQIHDLNTKALTDPAYVAFDDGTDTYKTEFNDVVADAAAAAVADADLTDNTVAFTSGDAASPTAWTAVDVLTSGLPLKTLFNRISTMVKNVRWLYSKLGTTDISSIGGGTVTGAISALNGNLAYASIRGADVLTLSSAFASATISDFVINRIGRIAHVTGIIGALSIQAGRNVIGTLGNGWRPHVFEVFTLGTIGPGGNVGTIVRVEINSNGVLTVVSDVAIASSLRFGCSYTLAV